MFFNVNNYKHGGCVNVLCYICQMNIIRGCTTEKFIQKSVTKYLVINLDLLLATPDRPTLKYLKKNMDRIFFRELFVSSLHTYLHGIITP